MRKGRGIALLAGVALALASLSGGSALPAKDPRWSKAIQDWGYLSAKSVKAPKGGGCTSIPVVLDIRNSANFPRPVAQVLVSDD